MRLLPLCFLILLAGTCVRAQCPTGLDIRSNDEVNAFVAQFPECTELRGRLMISGAAVTDISGLSQLTKVDGAILIEKVRLQQLEGLHNIQSICGDLTVRDCPDLRLVGFTGGTALRNVQGAIGLSELPMTSSISWFQNLSILSSGFGSNVVSISNLDELSGLGGSMAYLTLTDNPFLNDIGGLNDLTTVNELTITGNPNLSDCAIAPVCTALGLNRPATIANNSGNCNDVATVGQACGQPCTHPDYEALEALYTNTDGDNWSDNTGWLTDCDPCSWFGVTCVNGRVTELNLPGNGLDGPMVPELSSLVALERLHLPGNALTGNFSRLIWGLPLRHVNVSDNQLNTTDDAGDMPLLEFVNLSGNNFVTSDLPVITEAPNLRIFNASGAGFIDQVPDTYNATELPALQRLDLSDNALFDELPAAFGEFTSLTGLNLRGNNFVGCYPASYANLCAGNVTVVFQGNPNLPDGGSLAFFENDFCDDGVSCDPGCHPDYEALADFYTATAGDNWTDKGGWLTDCEPCGWFGVACDTDGRVTRLSLFNNNLIGDLPDVFAGLPLLLELSLPNNDLSGTVPPSLVALPNLQFVNLQLNDLSGSPQAFGQATGLTELNLIGNDFTGTLTDWLPQLTNLERLSLGSNQLSGPLPDFSGMQQLVLLALNVNAFTGPLPPELGDLPLLTGLRLEDNDLSGCYPDSYASFCDDSNVIFQDNPGLPDGGSGAAFRDVFCQTGNNCALICPTGDLIINNQQQLDDFQADFPLCTRFSGSIQVGSANVTNLTGLENLTFVEGTLSLREYGGTDLLGITGIDTIMGDLVLDDCPNLGANGFTEELDLRHIGNVLTARDLPMVTTSLPVGNLQHIGASLNIIRTGLTNLNGFSSLQEIMRFINIEENPALTDLSGLDRSGGSGNRQATSEVLGVFVEDNAALTSLDGLAGWTIVSNGSLRVTGNAVLSDCAAQTVCDRLTVGTTNGVTIENNLAGCDSEAEVESACQSLPVNWLSFSARAVGKTVRLDWSTTDETDNAGFVVQRSPDGNLWTDLGHRPPANPAADGAAHYDLTDDQPLPGTSYYRVRQEDLDGTTDHSPVRTVTFNDGVASVYPNPTTGLLTLTTTERQRVELIAADGRRVRQFMHPGSAATVDLSGLRAGVYWLRLSATGKTLRIVVR